MQPNTQLQATVYRTSAQICERYQITAVTLYRWERDENLGFPQPVKINRRKLYVLAEIEAWERSQAAASRRQAA
jgi:predicted DNA-binding transcriptional regulator AlpA